MVLLQRAISRFFRHFLKKAREGSLPISHISEQAKRFFSLLMLLYRRKETNTFRHEAKLFFHSIHYHYFYRQLHFFALMEMHNVCIVFLRGGNVKNDRGEQFDASVGLAFSLRALERYRTSGMLSAGVRAVPGIRGQCQAFLELIEGKVVACYFADHTGKRYPAAKESLLQLEQTKGPLGWIFREQAGTPSVAQAPQFPIPTRLVDNLDGRYLQRWTPEQQRCLSLVFSMIDGRRGMDEIKEQVLLPPTVVDEVIRILLLLQAIAMQ
jgi:hypothetical protein